jgi:glycosyltransferase involved in cell wall biosynthesis
VDPVGELGGHSSYVRAHARAAVRLGLTPHLFCAAPHADVVETDFGVIHRVASPFRPFRQLMVPGHGPLIARALERFLGMRDGPHLIHSFGLWGSVGASAAATLRRKGIAARAIANLYTTCRHETQAKVGGLAGHTSLVLRARHELELAWIQLAVEPHERRAYRGSRLVLVNYESVRGILSEAHGSARGVRNIAYAPETAFLSSPTHVPAPSAMAALEPRDAPLIVAVSRHDPRKGLDTLIRAFAMLRAQGVAFRGCLVGGGLLLEPHRRLVTRLGLASTVAVEGWVRDVTAYLHHAGVFALPSLEEGSGSVSLLEAMQHGLPVVASNVDGIPEDIVHGRSGLLVPPGDARDLADALHRLLQDVSLRQRLGNGARQAFSDRFTADRLTASLGDLYAELGFPPPNAVPASLQ